MQFYCIKANDKFWQMTPTPKKRSIFSITLKINSNSCTRKRLINQTCFTYVRGVSHHKIASLRNCRLEADISEEFGHEITFFLQHTAKFLKI